MAENIDTEEVARFAAQADLWWDRKGQFKALHDINPARLGYVRDRTGLTGKQVLDVGCGGGLLAEAMAARGARVTGIDMVTSSLSVAKIHARRSRVHVAYRQGTAEAWARTYPETYDIVTCMELVEHVPEPASIVRACSRLLRPGGDLFFATVNRTWLARLLVIWASEYLLGIVRKGTHTYRKFVQPQELAQWGRHSGLTVENLSGLRYIPFFGHTALCNSTKMNYLMHLKKKGTSSI